MREITIDDKTFQYEVVRHLGEGCEYMHTRFYQGTTQRTYRRWVIFGKKITTTIPREVFRIYADADNEAISKDWWNKMIKEKLKLLSRREELDKGELI